MRACGVSGRTRAPSDIAWADANLPQIWARDGSGRTHRFGCVAPLERAKPARRSGRRRADAMRRPAGDALIFQVVFENSLIHYKSLMHYRSEFPSIYVHWKSFYYFPNSLSLGNKFKSSNTRIQGKDRSCTGSKRLTSSIHYGLL
jgi:hypothetical protein